MCITHKQTSVGEYSKHFTYIACQDKIAALAKEVVVLNLFMYMYYARDCSWKKGGRKRKKEMNKYQQFTTASWIKGSKRYIYICVCTHVHVYVYTHVHSNHQ